MLDRSTLYSIILLSSLVSLHFGGSYYLQNTNSQILQNQISLVPTVLAASGAGLFLIKGALSYRALERMISKAAIVGQYYKTKMITHISLQTTIIFSDLTAFFALAMFSFVVAGGQMTPHQKEVYDQVELYAYVFIPVVSLFSIWLERKFSASNRSL